VVKFGATKKPAIRRSPGLDSPPVYLRLESITLEKCGQGHSPDLHFPGISADGSPAIKNGPSRNNPKQFRNFMRIRRLILKHQTQNAQPYFSSDMKRKSTPASVIREWRKRRIQQILSDPRAFDSTIRQAVSLLISRGGKK